MTKQTDKSCPAWANEFATKDYIDEKLTDFKSEILNAVDEVLGEVKASREEQTLIAGKLSEHTDVLDDHENRIGKLEKPIFPETL